MVGPSLQGVLSRRRLELLLPLKDPGPCGGSLSLRHVAGALQGDGERGVGQRVGGCDGGERQGRGDGLLEQAGVAEGANEAVMGFGVRFGVFRSCGNCRSEGTCCLGRLPGGEEIEGALVEQFGGGGVGFGHGCY